MYWTYLTILQLQFVCTGKLRDYCADTKLITSGLQFVCTGKLREREDDRFRVCIRCNSFVQVSCEFLKSSMMIRVPCCNSFVQVSCEHSLPRKAYYWLCCNSFVQVSCEKKAIECANGMTCCNSFVQVSCECVIFSPKNTRKRLQFVCTGKLRDYCAEIGLFDIGCNSFVQVSCENK